MLKVSRLQTHEAMGAQELQVFLDVKAWGAGYALEGIGCQGFGLQGLRLGVR